jgi:phosphoribosylglycinamide formyltransferase-1
LQRKVPVIDGDTAETLSARILEHEHRLYVEAVKKLITDPMGISSF